MTSSIEKAETGTVGTVHANSPHQALPQYPPLRKIANPAPLYVLLSPQLTVQSE